ncbi:vitamin B12-dependent ribonucleotide reductase [bacterium]|nr:vitamin B12-dependent ribonucleotide reductase [candidate division CSSED10-310 bacterium]
MEQQRELLSAQEGTPRRLRAETRGAPLRRLFTSAGIDPMESVVWEQRTAEITGEDGSAVFLQRDVEIPGEWSQLATNVVVSKYFRGVVGEPEREFSVKQLIGRVVRTITHWGDRDGYFSDEEEREVFRDELAYLLLHQVASFNSPVWFNVGYEDRPQCSACFITAVEDTLESILNLVKIEGMLFKWGSGTGVNLSALRSSREHLSGGGTASGPVSFMRGYDSFAGVIKSGGKTRRAAKMVVLNADHPDILDFIRCKELEERKAQALIEAGYDGSFNGEAYSSIFFQNANNSVRVTDDFMVAVLKDGQWQTKAITTGRTMDMHKARDLMKLMAKAAHACGDPGLQFDSTVNRWHTCPASGRINASNPCSEFMFLDNSACNLASLNLLTFLRDDGVFDVTSFVHAVDILITAQEIIVDNAGYPTARVEEHSHEFRPLGLGYANLGALLMNLGLAYNSDEGREVAAAVTALMTGRAYLRSAHLARVHGAFDGFAANRRAMLEVIRRHQSSIPDPSFTGAIPVWTAAEEAWRTALEAGEQHGFRNAQVTLLAPTGTIGFMMDCDTTGIEPDLALVKYKKLVGGGMLKLVNNSVPNALRRLGYSAEERDSILAHIELKDTIEGADVLKPEDLPVFDCAFLPIGGSRCIEPMGHLKMMAAVQPFISGAISKTVNLPNEVTWEEVEDIYIKAWQMGLKSISIYRDGSKRAQPMSTRKDKKKKARPEPMRHRLPAERRAITHKFDISGHEGYITVGMYEDGNPGEIFVVMAKEGSTISGLMDVFATTVSITLQYGIPLQVLVNKFIHTRFEPSGFTSNRQIPIASSITDYISRWLAMHFLPPDELPPGVTPVVKEQGDQAESEPPGVPEVTFVVQDDAPPCSECGAIMVRSGACYKCANCGATSGCS